MRDRLLRAVIAVVIIFICLFPWAQDLYALLAKPMLAALPKGGQMIATEVTTPFFVPVKVTMMAAFLLAMPWVFYQAWAFVAPGLYQHEKRIGVPLVIASVILFLLGMAFAYFLVFPIVFGFIVGVAPEGVAVMTDIGKYLDFVMTLFMAFGITFEVPVAVVLLVKMGMVSIAKLREIRPYVIVGAFVDRRDLYPARRDFAVHARHPAVDSVRTGHYRRIDDYQAETRSRSRITRPCPSPTWMRNSTASRPARLNPSHTTPSSAPHDAR